MTVCNESFKEKLKNIRVALFDLDGTLYLGGKPFARSAEALMKLRRRGVKIVFLTNNSSKTRVEYENRLKKIGLFDGDRVFTSGEAAAKYLVQNGLSEKVIAFANKSVKESFREMGLEIVDKGAKTALLCYGTEFDYGDVCAFNEELYRGARYFATHADLVCPAEGCPLPDAGSFMMAFKTSSGRFPELVIGKPARIMGDIIAEEYGAAPNEIMMVGDRLYTDVRFGVNCGFLTALVLSGETDAAAYERSSDRADGVFSGVWDIAELI